MLVGRVLVVAVVWEADWREIVVADVMSVCLVAEPCVTGGPLSVTVVVAAVLVLRALFSRVG